MLVLGCVGCWGNMFETVDGCCGSVLVIMRGLGGTDWWMMGARDEGIRRGAVGWLGWGVYMGA